MSTNDDTRNVHHTVKESVKEDFYTKSWCSDLALKVEDRTLYVSKAVLGLTSPVFKAMLDGETEDGNSGEISLQGKKCCDVVEFLRCIYPNIANPVAEDNVLSVLPLAVEYKVDNLRQACESYLLECLDNDISTERLCVILDKANALSIKNLFEKSLLVAETRPFEDLDIACDKMAMPLIEKNKIVTRMFVDIKTKHENLMRQHNTARVLCRTYAEVSKEQKPLVDDFSQGFVSGETISLAIKYPWNDSKSMEVGGYTFTVNFEKKVGYLHWSVVNVKCNEMEHDHLECVSLVIVRNWMNGNNDIRQWESFKIAKTNDIAMKIFEVGNSMISDQTKGFIYKGISNFDIFFFVKQ